MMRGGMFWKSKTALAIHCPKAPLEIGYSGREENIPGKRDYISLGFAGMSQSRVGIGVQTNSVIENKGKTGVKNERE